jgi:hypothetical protein
MHKAGFVTLLVLTIVLTATVLPALGELSPISFGFPTMTTQATTTAFNTADINAFDFETANVGFPQTLGLGTGVSSSLGIPMVSQSDIVGQTAHTVEFAQTSQFSSFAFPAVDTGLGFAGFWGF